MELSRRDSFLIALSALTLIASAYGTYLLYEIRAILQVFAS